MQITRIERAERLRKRALDDTEGSASAAHLAEISGGDPASMQSAWCSFVPFAAHPVMVAPANRAMELLDAAASAMATRRTAAA